MVSHRFGDPDLRLPHSLRAALAPAVQKENDWPLLVVVPPPFFRQVNLKTISDALQNDVPVEEAGVLRWLWLGRVRCGSGFTWLRQAHCASQRQAGCAAFRNRRDIVPIIISIQGGARQGCWKFLAGPANPKI